MMRLTKFSSPKYFYQQTTVSKKIFWLGLMLLLCGWGLGLWVAPPDYQQGDAFRIIYIHVPTAFLSIFIYAVMGGLALASLIWRIKIAPILLNHCAEIGAIMTLIALITGSIWGKPMWGTFWVWDARLTSELILLFLYIGLLSVRSLYSRDEQCDKVMAILALVGLLDLPVIHYSVYWWHTLHQGATISFLTKPKIDFSMLYPLLICIFAMGIFCMSWILEKARISILWRERRQQWVQKFWNEHEKL